MNTKIIIGLSMALIFVVQTDLSAQQEKDPEQALYELYRENIEQWKGSDEVRELLVRYPDLGQVLDRLDHQKLDQSNNYAVMGFMEMLVDERLLDEQVDMLVEVLSPENVSFIEDLYWRIIESPSSKKVADLLVEHLMDAKEKLETRIRTLDRN